MDNPGSYIDYLWVDTLDCGHELRISMAVDVDRSDRVGELTVCWKCRETHDSMEDWMRTTLAVEYLGVVGVTYET